MICPQCGDLLAETVIQEEARLLFHRWLRHQSPAVQAIATWALVLAGMWAIGQLTTRVQS